MLEPVQARDRLSEIDMIRGFALFGVLLVNMFSFGADSMAWDDRHDQITQGIVRLFFDSKFWTLFSLLFGFGLGMQLQKFASRKWSQSILILLRRLALLFVFGMLHALIYEGDILMLYAELGVVLLLIHRFPPRLLVVLAVGLLLTFPVAHWLTPERFDDPAAQSVEQARAFLLEEREYSVYLTGSVGDILAYNAEVIPENPVSDYLWPDSGFAVLALFIMGYLLCRSGIFADGRRYRVLFARAGAWGVSIGLLATGGLWALMSQAGYHAYWVTEGPPVVQLAGDLLFVISMVALAIAYAAGLTLWMQTQGGRKILLPLASAGRVALSLYLTQALIFTTLFHGYGFGLAFRMGPFSVAVCALCIFSAQVWVAHAWLQHFRFGPFEWLWRSLTYLSWQPLRR